MALDPTIPLAIRPPQDPTVGLMNAMRLRSEMQQQSLYPLQQQEMQQRIQGQDTANQLAQIQLDQQKRMMQFYNELYGGSGSSQATPGQQSGVGAAPSGPVSASASAPTPSSAQDTPSQPTPAFSGGSFAPAMVAPTDLTTQGLSPDAPANAIAQKPPTGAPWASAITSAPSPAAADSTYASPTALPMQGSSPTAQSPSSIPNTSNADFLQRATGLAAKYHLPPTVIAPLIEGQIKIGQSYLSLSQAQQEQAQRNAQQYAAYAQNLLAITDPAKRQDYMQKTIIPGLLDSGWKPEQIAQYTDTSDDAINAHLRYAGFLKSGMDWGEKQNQMAASAFGAANTQAEWDQTIQNLKTRGVDPQAIASFGTMYSPEAQQHAQMYTMKGEQQVKTPGEAAKSASEVQAEDAQNLRNAINSTSDPVTSRAAYIVARNQLGARAANFPQAPAESSYDPKTFADQINQAALSPQQAAQEKLRQTQQQYTQAWRQSNAAFKNTRFQWEQDQAAAKRGLNVTATDGTVLTPSQYQAAEKRFDTDENGTAAKPGGLNLMRQQLGSQLAGNYILDSKGNKSTMTPEQRTALQNQYNEATNHQQQIQFERANNHGIQRPDASSVMNAKEGDSLTAPDGSNWKKQGGILWFQGKGGTQPAPTATPAPKPGPTNPSTPPPNHPAAPGNGSGTPQRITVKLPNGKYLTGTREQLQPFLDEAGLKLNQ